MKRVIGVLTTMCCIAASSAWATTYTPSYGDLLQYEQIAADSARVNAENYGSDGNGGVEFNVSFGSKQRQAFAEVGLVYDSGLNLSSYTSFMLGLRNNDRTNPWGFKLVLKDYDSVSHPEVDSPLTQIAAGNTQDLRLDFSADKLFNYAGVDEINVYVTAYLPMVTVDALGRHTDATADFNVDPFVQHPLSFRPTTPAAAVPEPGTLVLLAGGCLGLAICGKRRRNA